MTPARPKTLSTTCDELLLLIFTFLDVPDLLCLSRTSRRLRTLSLDPLLHACRRHVASARLSQHLPYRPSLSSLRPPSSTIYLSTTYLLARSVSRQLIAIRLKRSLSRRPTASSLVQHNILPHECYGRAGGGVAPGLVGARRSVERERVKDSLRRWLEGKRARVERQGERDEERSVRGLVRRFTAWRTTTSVNMGESTTSINIKLLGLSGSAAAATSIAAKKPDVAPTRAHVLGLRRFWEGLAKG